MGRETKRSGINMQTGMVDEIEKRAQSMHISTAKYCKIVLSDWLVSGKKLQLQER